MLKGVRYKYKCSERDMKFNGSIARESVFGVNRLCKLNFTTLEQGN
jgi:hypothetical protein